VWCGGGTLASPWAGQPTVPAPRRPHRAPSHLGLPHTRHAGERSAATTRSRGARSSSNTFQRRRFARQPKPIQECHPERSEGSLSGERSFAALRMTQRDGLLFEMYWGLPPPCGGAGQSLVKRLRSRLWGLPPPCYLPSLVKSNRTQLAQPALFCYTYTAESTCYSSSLLD
jgi:hypothetical protein